MCSSDSRVTEIAASTDIFRVVVDEAKDFVILGLDDAGMIRLWSSGAERILGWSAGEAVGHHFSMIFQEDDRLRGVPEQELIKARKLGRAEDARWHLRKDGSVFFADGVTTAIRGGGFAKVARDVTDRYRTEKRLVAQLALTNLLSEEKPFEATARQIMQTICENLGWDVGALWEIEGDVVRCADLWHAANVDDAAARALCIGRTMKLGEGLIGQVCATGEAVWVTDFRDGSRFPRGPLAAAAGLTAAFAFPIATHGRALGAMEFFSRTSREPDQALLPVMTLIGAQIGDHIERRRAQRALRESEERYRLVADTAQDAIFTIDVDSTILFCNPAVQRVFGYAPEELIGRDLQVIIPERFRAAHRRGIERYLRTRRQHIPWSGVELPALRKDGTEFPCEISFGEWTEGGRTIFTGFARDITERQRAREELQQTLELEQRAREEAEQSRAQLERRAEEEAAFRHLASALTGAVEMNDVLYEITNRATQVTRADGVYVERIALIGGQKIVEVVWTSGRGTPPRGLRVPYPGSMTDEIMHGRQPVVLGDMSGFGRAMAPYLADACENCEVLVAPLVAEDEVLGALVLLNSSTSGRRFRDGDTIRARTLGDMTSLALRRVRLMEQEREAKEKAEAAVRVRDETLGIVSHDLRNPLTKIALSADLLTDAPPEDHRDLIETIRSASKQMQRLIQDLLDVARVESGRLSVDKAMLDPTPLLRYVCESHEPIANQREQRIVCRIEGELPEICADRDRLLQVFNNLVGNAMKFAPPRGMITVDALPRTGHLEFSIADSGPGIPEADLKNVFRPYWQAKKTAHMGAGLGLAIVRGIVEAHGGKVWAENLPGGGAMFRFTIPLG